MSDNPTYLALEPSCDKFRFSAAGTASNRSLPSGTTVKNMARKTIGMQLTPLFEFAGACLFLTLGVGFQLVLPRFWGLWIPSYFVGVILFAAYAKWLLQTRLAADVEAASNSNPPNSATARNVARIRVGLQLTALFIVLFGPILLLLGVHDHVISQREFGIGLLSYFFGVMLLAALVKLLERKRSPSDAQGAMSFDDKTRGWLERWIWLLKAWIGILVISLPLEIANGIAHHALLPTSVGVGINLLMMYVATKEIRRMQKLIHLSIQDPSDIK
jgi:hypothetical protein